MNSNEFLQSIQVEGIFYLLMTLLISVWFPLWGVLLVSGIGCIDLTLSLGYFGWLQMKEPCPNCEAANEVGKDNNACILCADPKTGLTRGWVWRWNWLHYRLVSRHNFKKVEKNY